MSDIILALFFLDDILELLMINEPINNFVKYISGECRMWKLDNRWIILGNKE